MYLRNVQRYSRVHIIFMSLSLCFIVSFLHSVQTGSGARAASYPRDFPGNKEVGA